MRSSMSSSYQAAPAGIDIGSVITMMLPVVVIAMMSSGNAKDAEGKDKDKDKAAKAKDKQDKVV